MLNIPQVIMSYFLETTVFGLSIVSLLFSFVERSFMGNLVKKMLEYIMYFLILLSFGVGFLLKGPDVLSLTFLFVLIACLNICIVYNSSKISNFSVYFLLIAGFLGMLFATKVTNFISLYLSFELISFTGYILVALSKKNHFDGSGFSEAGMKYFIIGGLSSAIMLFGISLVYGATGSVMFSAMNQSLLVSVGLVLFLCGLFFKLTAFPFHFWAPDVYYATNIPSLSAIAIFPKVGGLLALSSVMNFVHVDIIFYVITVVAVLSMLVGSLGGMMQGNIQKIFAYSGIANMGYILAIYTNESFSLLLLLEFITVYVVSSLLVLLLLVGMRKNLSYNGTVESLKGFAGSNPVMSFVFVFALLNLAGIPPLAGFVIKFMIIKHLMYTKASVVLIAGIVVSSVLALFYYLRIIKSMYIDSLVEDVEERCISVSLISKFLIGFAVVFLLVYFYLDQMDLYQVFLANF